MTMPDKVAVDIEEDIEHTASSENALGMCSSSEETKILSVQKQHRSHLQELVVSIT